MLIGWLNPLTGKKVDLFEFDEMKGVVPYGVLAAILRKEQTDVRHQGAGLTITMGLGCPRKTMIQRMLPVHADPKKMWAAMRGTLLHEQMGHAMGTVEGWWTEEVDEDKCVYEGTLFGWRMSCKVDALRKDYGELWDFKFRSDFARKFIGPDLIARETDSAQLNMARLLMEQTLGRGLGDMRMTEWIS